MEDIKNKKQLLFAKYPTFRLLLNLQGYKYKTGQQKMENKKYLSVYHIFEKIYILIWKINKITIVINLK